MQYINGTTAIHQIRQSIVVLGIFDGVHRGHQKLFELAKEKARLHNLQIVALSFYPHPTWVLGNHPKPLLLSREQKKRKLQELGVHLFIEYPFTKAFASIEPETFFKEILVEQLMAKMVIVGENYCFGKNQTGNLTTLKRLGKEYAVDILGVETVTTGGFVISSTHVREAIAKGEMEKARQLLGYPYTLIGTVIHGKKRGRTIGYPTINMEIEEKRIYPPKGVYVTRVKVYNEEYMGITNIGYNPTVEGTKKGMETHLLDFEGDLYGKEIEICFYHFIREEKKFSSLESLTQQLRKDEEKARFLLQES